MGYLTQDDHEHFARHFKAGRIEIGVDTIIARRFFTDAKTDDVVETLGEPLSFQRGVVKSAFVLEFLSVITSIGVAVWVFRWWATILAPVGTAIWVMYRVGVPARAQKITTSSCFFLLTLVVCAEMYSPIQVWIATYTAAFFFTRWTYFSATIFLRTLVVRNQRAYAAFQTQGMTWRWAHKA